MTEKFSKEHIPVFFHCSDYFAPFMSVTIASILCNTKEFIDFYVIETGITNSHKKMIEDMKKDFDNFSIEWITFEYNDIFKKDYFEGIYNFPQKNQWPGIHAFATPFMPLLKPNIDKFIYLDTDIIFVDDIKKLYEQDIENIPLAASPELVIPLYLNELIFMKNKNIHYDEYGNYFNAGLLLVNAKYFRENNIIEKYFYYAKTELMQIADQDCLNRLFYKKAKILDVRFNFIYMPFEEKLKEKNINIPIQYFENERKEIIARHFADRKPWHHTKENWSQQPILLQEDFWSYAEKSPFYSYIKMHFISNKLDLLEYNICNKSPKNKENGTIKIKILHLTVLKLKYSSNEFVLLLFGYIPLFKGKKK